MSGFNDITALPDSMVSQMIRELIVHEQTVSFNAGAPFFGYVGTEEQFQTVRIPRSMSPALIVGQAKDIYSQPGVESYFTEGKSDLTFRIFLDIPKREPYDYATDILSIRNNVTKFFFSTLIDSRFTDAVNAYPFEGDRFYPINGQFAPVVFRDAASLLSGGEALGAGWFEISTSVTFYFNNRGT